MTARSGFNCGKTERRIISPSAASPGGYWGASRRPHTFWIVLPVGLKGRIAVAAALGARHLHRHAVLVRGRQSRLRVQLVVEDVVELRTIARDLFGDARRRCAACR